MVYIYQADLWCDECGKAIRRRIKAEGHAPKGETPCDSDEYPKHAHEGESDSPNHCAAGDECPNAIELSDGRKVGELLTEDLTSDGEEYVRQAIAEGHLCAVEVWAEKWPDLKPTVDRKDVEVREDFDEDSYGDRVVLAEGWEDV